MAKKSFNQEDSKPFDGISEVKAAHKPEKTPVGNLVTTLRTDMVPASDAQPARKSIFQRENLIVAVGILFSLVIIGLIIYLLTGPGRPTLEQGLVSLVRTEITSTKAVTSSPFPATNTPPQPSNTPHQSPTFRPTITPVVEIVVSPTLIPASATSTSAPECRDVLTITLTDVGQTLCVQGVVIETVANPTDFMVIFSNKPGAFYWVSYDLVWSKAELDTCYQTRGMIERIANSPVLLFNYSNLPVACP
jgi:hypothetical protein